MIRKKFLLCIAAVVTLLTSCSSANTETVLPQETQTSETGETITMTTETFPETTPPETVSEAKTTEPRYTDMYGVEGVKIYEGDYEDFEISGALEKRIPGWRRENEITGGHYGYAQINGYKLISTYSGWFSGNTRTAHVITEKDGVVTEINAEDIQNLSEVYYIEDGVLYSFDDTLSAGITRFVLGKFDLATGEKLMECGDVHSMNSDPEFFSDDPEIDSMEKLKDYIREISPVWYRTHGGEWETIDEDISEQI